MPDPGPARAVVVGAGAVGARVARQLLVLGEIQRLTVVETDRRRAQGVLAALGPVALAQARVTEETFAGASVAVLAAPGPQRALAEAALEAGAHVVSVADDVGNARDLLDLDVQARERRLNVVVGAGFSPGLSCLLAAHAARSLEGVDEIHVAKVGTGGPACARQHHRSFRQPALEWRDGVWRKRRGGGGRQLAWFPDPVGGVDCYVAAVADPPLLVAAFPGANRVTSRVGANRRDRFTGRMPMLRRPHLEGALAAVRVEVRGTQGPEVDERVLGAVDRPAVAAGVVSAQAAWWAVEGRLARPGAGGLAELAEPGPFLAALAERGVKAAVFEGAEAQAASA